MKNNSSTSLDLALRFFENFSERSLMDIELARENGRPIAGGYCIYAPLELIRAAGCVPLAFAVNARSLSKMLKLCCPQVFVR